MREVVAGLFISLDGVVEAPDQWQFDLVDEDMLAALEAEIAQDDAVLMGRVTYEAWAAFWPTSDVEPYASFINKVPKYVVSRTLEAAPWGEGQAVTILRGDLAPNIARLKAEPGRRIAVSGSPTLVRSLLAEGLLDSLTLMIHPVVVGRGRRLFEEGDPLQRLRLLESTTTRSGVLIATYRPLPRA